MTAPMTKPVVHPASYSPFEAGSTRAALASTPSTAPRTPPAAPRAGDRPANSRADERPPANPSPVAGSTPAGEPESWDWVVALGVGPLELAAAPAPGLTARSDRSEGASDRDAKDRDGPPPPSPETTQSTPVPRDAVPSDAEPAVDPTRFLPADHARWPGHWAAAPTAWRTPEAELLAAETRQVILGAIEALPPAQREVIVLRDIEGLESSAACDILEITDTHQRVLLHRARSRVRHALEGYSRPNGQGPHAGGPGSEAKETT